MFLCVRKRRNDFENPAVLPYNNLLARFAMGRKCLSDSTLDSAVNAFKEIKFFGSLHPATARILRHISGWSNCIFPGAIDRATNVACRPELS